MVTLIIWLVIGIIFFAVVYALFKRVPMPPDLAWLKEVVLIAGVGIFLLWLVYLFAGALGAPAQRTGQHAAEGEGEVAAGVAIGHRENIDAVEGLALGDHPARTGDQRAAQRGATDQRARDFDEGDIHGLPESAASRWRRAMLRRRNRSPGRRPGNRYRIRCNLWRPAGIPKVISDRR